MKTREQPSVQNPNILKIVPSWQEFFSNNASLLTSQCVVVAEGGTVDMVVNDKNQLIPMKHPVDIISTQHLSAIEIGKLFIQHAEARNTLGALYPWTVRRVGEIPWVEVKVTFAGRISGFDSGQETNNHFVAGLVFDKHALTMVDKLMESQGTDSLVDKSALKAIVYSRFLVDTGKKIITVGATTPGYEEYSDAASNITGGLYAILEKELPGGVYIISSEATRDGEFVTQILPALGAVKLHSDGKFHAPNSGPLLTIQNGIVYIHPLYHEMKRRLIYSSALPDFSSIYLASDKTVTRLEDALNKVTLETVKNDPSILDQQYQSGKRAFVIKARGAGNGSNAWKQKIADIVKKKDTTVLIITLADSGDVNLKKYAAGLYVPGVLSGRTLREEAACVLAGIIQDLRMHNQLTIDAQHIIESFCYLSGMIEVPSTEISAFI